MNCYRAVAYILHINKFPLAFRQCNTRVKEKFSNRSFSLQIQDFLANKSSAEETFSEKLIEHSHWTAFTFLSSRSWNFAELFLQAKTFITEGKMVEERKIVWRVHVFPFSPLLLLLFGQRKKNQWILFSFLFVSRRSLSSESALDGSMLASSQVWNWSNEEKRQND